MSQMDAAYKQLDGAHAEIAALKAELKQYQCPIGFAADDRKICSSGNCYHCVVDRLEELSAERDRLTIIADAIQAERDRLKVERDDAVKVWRIMDACRQHAEEECNKLRAALERISTHSLNWPDADRYMQDIARRALEGKP